MAETKIVVGPQPFSVGEEYPRLAERDEDGAVVTFTGKVRKVWDDFRGADQNVVGQFVAEKS